MNTPQISAIICTHNRDTYLGAAIDSLLTQDFPNFEVVVVDNASSDRTKEWETQALPETSNTVNASAIAIAATRGRFHSIRSENSKKTQANPSG